MSRLIRVGDQPTGFKTVFFHLVEDDGITPVTGEANGQPEISINGAPWVGAGAIGQLEEIGHGRYYAVLTQSTVAVGNLGKRIETRYKSANTAECPGDSADLVDFALYDATTIKSDATGANQAAIVEGVEANGTAIEALPSASDVDAELSGSHGAGNWEGPDVSGLSTFDPAAQTVDVGAIAGTAVTGPGDLKSDATAANQAEILTAVGTIEPGFSDDDRSALAGVKVQTDRIGALEVTYQGPAGHNEDFCIFAGDDYLAATGRAIEIEIADYAGADLTDATCKLRLASLAAFDEGDAAAECEVEATITVAGSTVTLSADLTATETAALGTYPPSRARNYVYQFIATLADETAVVTLAAGRCTVNGKIAQEEAV